MKKPKTMDPEELALFRDSLSDVRPLNHDTVVHRRAQKPRQAVQQQQQRREADHYFSDSYQPALPTEGPMRYVKEGVSSYEVKRLRRGDYVPEVLLDLHGHTQAEARQELIALINACKKQHLACASVMHGLGSGVLKRQVPAWLTQHPDVLAFHQAPLEWGGDGALLVLVDIGLNDEG
ncbi:endonuclease SmrB [Ferrimonas balearica]|uniref:endonuclease SmrB n=1 Tax=Ferrimonas balearica TaxID=44012 RepID=UPI001C991B40|nr:endonuclease SmrB [Ferrimonas balearica]MBY5993755.1 endonuclease SmrB [Ferrimonas balearica]